jgi:hypothetical protein
MDTAQAPIGDDEHDFLNPDLGCQWDQVFNDANTVNLPFQTRPDTLVVQEGQRRFRFLKSFLDGMMMEMLGNPVYAAGE